jgi:hypothetical protein
LFADDAGGMVVRVEGPLMDLQGRLAPPVNRILVIIATVGMFAFVAAIVGGAFRPPVYSLAGKP